MSKLVRSCADCGCEPPNCEVTVLRASKVRYGWPPIYVSAIHHGGRLSTRKYRTHTTIFDHTHDWGGYTGNVHNEWTATANRQNGKVTYSESGSTSGTTGFSSDPHALFNQLFHDWRTYNRTTYTSHVGDSSDPSGETYVTWTLTLTYDGIDLKSLSFVYQDWSKLYGVLQEQNDITGSIVLSDEYTNAHMQDDVDDLLRFQTTDTGLGLDGMADSMFGTIAWNDCGVQSVVGGYYPRVESGVNAIWFDYSTLTAYTTVAAPAIVYSSISAVAFWTGSGYWWQHYPDSPADGIYSCTFADEWTMPATTQTDSIWSSEVSHSIRFNVAGMICATIQSIDADATITSACSLIPHKFYQPHPVAATSYDVQWFYAWTFTSPGALTSGGCPCV